MAKLTNTTAFGIKTQEAWDDLYGYASTVKVGNNRTVRMQDGVLRCSLHGSAIVTYDPKRYRLVIRHCGYPTTTTVAAISDFCGELPWNGMVKAVVGASRAGERFSVTFHAQPDKVRSSSAQTHTPSTFTSTTFKEDDMNIDTGFEFDVSNPRKPKLAREPRPSPFM